MRKVVYLPLDERPCNYMFPQYLYKGYINLAVPKREILGDKKKEANTFELIKFLKEETKDADALVVSLDMLVYGGLLPSRIHYLDKKVLEERLSVLKELKEANKNLKIYGFVLIMRCPKYSSDDEEPTYYNDCGKEIHELGTLIHKQKLGMEVDENRIKELKEFITEKNLNDFLDRRKGNLEIVKEILDYRRDGIIDHLVIPQDDSAPYGFTAMDQAIVRDKISENELDSTVLMYPDADAVGFSLISRCLLHFENKKPKVYIKYAGDGAELVIPPYEDRPLGVTAKYHIMSAGGRIVTSYSEADIVLCFTNPSGRIGEARSQAKRTIESDCFRNLPELIDFIKDAIKDNKPVIIADNAYANGGDLTLLRMFNNEKLLDKFASYAGWNTNANTLGSTLAMGFLYYLDGPSKAHYDFLALRYLEDCGYCGLVRTDIAVNHLEKLGFNWFYCKEERGEVAKLAWKKLEEFRDKYLSSVKDHIVIKDVYMPWRRIFEIGIVCEWKNE